MNQALFDYIAASPTAYHAAAHTAALLDKAGYTALCEGEDWALEPGQGYYVTRNGSSLIAFRVPEGEWLGFMMAAAHSDSPTFKIKENSDLADEHHVRLSVEKYGGMLCASWMDRPLSIAGRVTVRRGNGVEVRLVDLGDPCAVIPNVAIHMNRKANDGYAWNPAVDTLPLLGGKDADSFWDELGQLAGGRVLGHDLFLYVRQKSALWGMDKAFLSAPALDDLECAWGCTRGFLEAGETDNIPVLCVFNNEETGSSSYEGAASDFLKSVLGRICAALGLDEARQWASSFLVSADNAHALHPNHPELSDSANAPVLNGGVVIKFNSARRYITDGATAAVFRKICARANVPTQTYYNRADIPGGSTLGNVSLSQVAVPGVDIGLAQLAMHSCYETAGAQDAKWLVEAMTAYYGTAFSVKDGEFCIK